MGGSSRLDERQHMHSSHPPLHINSRHDTLDQDPQSTTAVKKSPEPSPDRSVYKYQRHPSHSPFPAGLASIPQQSLEYSHTQETSSGVRVPPDPARTNVYKPADGQQAVPEMLASNIHRSRAPVLVPRSPSDNNVGQKRPATGVTKALADPSSASPVSGVDSVERRRSRSIGSLSRESKIAALSVHLRTRLSYAAAKIEKNRKTHGGYGHSRSPSTDSPVKIEHLASLGEIDAQHLVSNLSAPNAPPASHIHPLNGPARLSPVARSADASPSPPEPRTSHPSSTRQARPNLAPPVDIVASGGGGRRRRPNPNEVTKPSNFPPFLHRRHHSQQDFGVSRPAANLESVLVPGTPPLRPSSQSTSTPYNGLIGQGHSQSSAMEQDAIETLLFMSSPEHSGYHSNSQHSQRQHVFQSSSESRGSDGRVPCSQDSHVRSNHGRPVYGFRGEFIGLEAQAGDEIDRMLDQMDSDSDDDVTFGSQPSSVTDIGSRRVGSSRTSTQG